MAGEDGAVIAAVLAKITDKSQVNKALLQYQVRRHFIAPRQGRRNVLTPFLPSLPQRLRKPRADWAVEQARITGHNLHLPDGPEQQKRDAAITAAQKVGGTNPDKWGDK